MLNWTWQVYLPTIFQNSNNFDMKDQFWEFIIMMIMIIMMKMVIVIMIKITFICWAYTIFEACTKSFYALSPIHIASYSYLYSTYKKTVAQKARKLAKDLQLVSRIWNLIRSSRHHSLCLFHKTSLGDG